MSIRVALYSHDTCGLGHLRRNLLIARTLRSRLGANVLLVSGIREAGAYPIGDGIDTLLLPALTKRDNQDYQPRRLGVSLSDLVRIRGETVRAALEAYDPDVLIVDNVPRGAVGELDATLKRLRRRTNTLCILGLRDVLDHPSNVEREWRRAANVEAIEQYYDRVWIYGDPFVYDASKAYGLPPSIRTRLSFTGYLDPLSEADGKTWDGLREGDDPDACLVGGGHDGRLLAQTFADACRGYGRPGMVLTGPFMREEEARLLAARGKLLIRRFSTDPLPLYSAARNVVCMGGYNTVLELLAIGKRPLVVPRVQPRQEQLLRAQALDRLGLVDLLHPADLTASGIAEWLRVRHRPEVSAHEVINMRGLDTITEQIRESVRPSPRAVTAIAS